MNPLVGLVLSVGTLLILAIAILASETSPVLKLAFVALVAPGVVMAVLRYRERR